MVIAEPEVRTAPKPAAPPAIEYRLEQLPVLNHPERHLAEILDRLTELGRQGWRVISIDLTHHPSYSVAAQPAVPLPVLLAKPAGARPVEYRIERLPFAAHPERHLAELLERITQLGRERWEVASVDMTHHPSYSVAAQPAVPLPVLLQREL